MPEPAREPLLSLDQSDIETLAMIFFDSIICSRCGMNGNIGYTQTEHIGYTFMLILGFRR